MYWDEGRPLLQWSKHNSVKVTYLVRFQTVRDDRSFVNYYRAPQSGPDLTAIRWPIFARLRPLPLPFPLYIFSKTQ